MSTLILELTGLLYNDVTYVTYLFEVYKIYKKHKSTSSTTSNGKTMMISKCKICNNRKCKFIKKREAKVC